jgi:hypothetical protein
VEKPHSIKQKTALLHTLLQIARKAVEEWLFGEYFIGESSWVLHPADWSKDSTGGMNCK